MTEIDNPQDTGSFDLGCRPEHGDIITVDSMQPLEFYEPASSNKRCQQTLKDAQAKAMGARYDKKPATSLSEAMRDVQTNKLVIVEGMEDVR